MNSRSMERRARFTKISRASVEVSNAQAKRYAKAILAKADRLANDPEKKQRLEKAECKSCYYLFKERIGGTMMVTKSCGICEGDITFSSTNTDAVCPSCAVENQLCKHCGGDIEMIGRRNRPCFNLINKGL